MSSLFSSLLRKSDVDVDLNLFKTTTKTDDVAEEDQRITILVCGDGAVGKTCLCIRAACSKFPGEYIPTVFDEFTMTVKWGRSYRCTIRDIPGIEDYDYSREKEFAGVTCFILCIDTTNNISLQHVDYRWMPDIVRVSPSVPIILVGTKIDLRKEIESNNEEFTEHDRESLVSTEDGEKCAKAINAFGYYECSSLKDIGVEKVFSEAVGASVLHKFLVHEKRAFGIGKKKIKSGLSLSDKKAKENIERAYQKRLEELKIALINEKKSGSEIFKQEYHKLSYDVILLILREFVVIRFSDLVEFNPTFVYFLPDLGYNDENKIFYQFFGYFPETSRKIEQIFFSFDVEHQEKCFHLNTIFGEMEKKKLNFVQCFLPRKVKFVQRRFMTIDFYTPIYYSKESALSVKNIKFGKYSSSTLEKMLVNTTSYDFNRLESLKTTVCGEYGAQLLFEKFIRCFPNVETLDITHEHGRYYNNPDGGFKKYKSLEELPEIGVLSLRGMKNSIFDRIPFSMFQGSLTHLRLEGQLQLNVESEQMDGIVNCTSLVEICMTRVTFPVQFEYEIAVDKLRNIKRVELEFCQFHSYFLDACKKTNMKVYKIVSLKQHHKEYDEVTVEMYVKSGTTLFTQASSEVIRRKKRIW